MSYEGPRNSKQNASDNKDGKNDDVDGTTDFFRFAPPISIRRPQHEANTESGVRLGSKAQAGGNGQRVSRDGEYLRALTGHTDSYSADTWSEAP